MPYERSVPLVSFENRAAVFLPLLMAVELLRRLQDKLWLPKPLQKKEHHFSQDSVGRFSVPSSLHQPFFISNHSKGNLSSLGFILVLLSDGPHLFISSISIVLNEASPDGTGWKIPALR